MAIRTRKNPYFGVNAHANSWMQNKSNGWRSFHHDHITDITRALNAVLPEGYIALSEESLQIKEISTTRTRLLSPAPDVTVFERTSLLVVSGSFTNPTEIETPTVDAMEIAEEKLAASVIYEVLDHEIGRPVTRIELLSPTNKRPSEGYEQYREKRNVALQSGIPLVEIDYLHQQPSVDKRLRLYPDEPQSHPYSIVISDPRPNIYKGPSHAIGFDVDQAIPPISIPLNAGQFIFNFDLNAVYNRTFENSPVFYLQIDYEMLPDKSETYSAADQARIQARMHLLKVLHQLGQDLDTGGPFLIEPNSP